MKKCNYFISIYKISVNKECESLAVNQYFIVRKFDWEEVRISWSDAGGGITTAWTKKIPCFFRDISFRDRVLSHAKEFIAIQSALVHGSFSVFIQFLYKKCQTENCSLTVLASIQ